MVNSGGISFSYSAQLSTATSRDGAHKLTQGVPAVLLRLRFWKQTVYMGCDDYYPRIFCDCCLRGHDSHAALFSRREVLTDLVTAGAPLPPAVTERPNPATHWPFASGLVAGVETRVGMSTGLRLRVLKKIHAVWDQCCHRVL